MYVGVLKRTCMCARVRVCCVFLLEFEYVRGVYVCVCRLKTPFSYQNILN